MSAKPAQAQPAQDKKPNILIIWGDDVGIWNISAYPPRQESVDFNIDEAMKALTPKGD